MICNRFVLLTPVLLAGVLAAGAAQAVDATRRTYPNAAFACQGALPAFAGTLRTRPMAISNEGDTTAFVTCSIEAGAQGTRRHTRIQVRVMTSTLLPERITCTLVNGYQTDPNDLAGAYITKSVLLDGGTGGTMAWDASELPGSPPYIGDPNLSCSLPPETALTYLGLFYLESVGN